MKITVEKFINNSRVVIEEECTLENLTETRRAMAKAVRYTLKDLEKAENDTKEATSAAKDNKPLLPLATEKQLAYLAKLGIETFPGMTKTDAQKAINDWKIANGIPLSGGPGYVQK